MEVIGASLNLMYAFESLKLYLYNSSYDPFSGTPTGCPVLTLYTVHIFSWEREGIWASVFHGNYSCICKLDVGF